MSCPICASHHGRSPICERLRDAAQSLELFAVPAFLTDPYNRIIWVNREFAMNIGDPVAEHVAIDDRFVPALLLGPYRARFPRARSEVSECVGALTPEVETGNLSLPTERLISRVLSAYRDILTFEPEHPWDGTIVFRSSGGPMRIVREQVIPLGDANGAPNGYHISVWCPADNLHRFGLEMVVQDATAGCLTARQREVALLYAAGLSSRAVAERIGVSHRTARDHVEAIYGRLGVHSRTELHAALSAAMPAGRRAERLPSL